MGWDEIIKQLIVDSPSQGILAFFLWSIWKGLVIPMRDSLVAVQDSLRKLKEEDVQKFHVDHEYKNGKLNSIEAEVLDTKKTVIDIKSEVSDIKHRVKETEKKSDDLLTLLRACK